MINALDTITASEEKNVKVVSFREDWLQTLDDSMRGLVLSILSRVAKWERGRIIERQLEAWVQGKQKGEPRKLKLGAAEKCLKHHSDLEL